MVEFMEEVADQKKDNWEKWKDYKYFRKRVTSLNLSTCRLKRTVSFTGYRAFKTLK